MGKIKQIVIEEMNKTPPLQYLQEHLDSAIQQRDKLFFENEKLKEKLRKQKGTTAVYKHLYQLQLMKNTKY